MDFSKQFKEYTKIIPIGVRLPQFKIDKKYYDSLNIPENSSNIEFLKTLCRSGIKERDIHKQKNKQKYYDRCISELDTIEELGFTDYMLLVWDIVNFAHENDVMVGAGRGSSAGSLVLYLIGVTMVDPIKYNLYFERFINKQRAKANVVDGITYFDGDLLCDVDMDFCYLNRHKVIEYIEQKFKGRTSKILTLDTLFITYILSIDQ